MLRSLTDLPRTRGPGPISFEEGAFVARALASGEVDPRAASAWIDFTQSGQSWWALQPLTQAEYAQRLAASSVKLDEVPWPAEEGARALAQIFEDVSSGGDFSRKAVETAVRRAGLKEQRRPSGAEYLAKRIDAAGGEKVLIAGWRELLLAELLPAKDVAGAQAHIDRLMRSDLPLHAKERLASEYRALAAGVPEMQGLWPAAKEGADPVPSALKEGAAGRYFAPWIEKRGPARRAVEEFLGHTRTRHTQLDVRVASARLGRHASRVGTFFSVHHLFRAAAQAFEKFERERATPELLARRTFKVEVAIEDLGFETGWSIGQGAPTVHRGVTAVIEKHPDGLIGLTTCYASGGGASFEMT